jgi:hypothetical protein
VVVLLVFVGVGGCVQSVLNDEFLNNQAHVGGGKQQEATASSYSKKLKKVV